MSNCKRFILLGNAGAGKSSFINFLYNCFYGTTETDKIFCDHPRVKLAIPCANWLDCLDQAFKNNHSEHDINDQTQSQTRKCTSYVFQKNDIHLEIIDTPGFNDTNGTDVDEQNLSFIQAALKEIPFLSGIIMVVNGAVSRLGTSFKNFLHLLHQVWPNDLLNNCVAILTNCDGLTVSLDPSILRRDMNVNDGRIFHLQNSLFHWDRKNHAPKTIRRFQQDFEDNLEIIKTLVKTLLQFNNVSTDAFHVGAIKILIIERCVCDSVNDMIQLLTAFKEQQVAEVGIEAAQHTMQSNKEWDKQQQINAIRWVEVPQHRSPSPPQPKQKFTRGIFFKDQSKTSSIKPASKEYQPHKSKSSDDSQEKRLSHSISYDHSPTKTHATVDNDRKRSQQPTHSGSSHGEYDRKKHSLSKSTSSEKANNYSSAYNSHSNNEQSRAAAYSSKISGSHSTTGAGRSYSTTEAGEKYDKQNLSLPFADHNRQRDLHSTPSSTDPCDNSYSRPVYRQEQTTIQVTIPDNEARSYHDSARRQEFALKERKQDLKDQQEILASSMKSLLENLKKQVVQLRSIHKNYDLIERNRERLLVFKEKMQVLGDDCQMQRYYDETVNILSNK